MLDVILCRTNTEETPKTYMEQLFTNTNMDFGFCNLSGGSDTEVAAIIFRCKGDSLGALKIWGGGGGVGGQKWAWHNNYYGGAYA